METKRLAQTTLVVFLISGLLLLAIPSFSCTTNMEDVGLAGTSEQESPKASVHPIIHRIERIDKDLNGLQDSLEATILQMIENRSAILPVIVTLYNPISSRNLDHFIMLGGRVTHVYQYVTYGFAGVIPAANISTFVSLEKENLCVIERDLPVHYHLDVSVPLIRARPTVWETYGYTGSPNHSIAIIDTGIDDSHPDIGPYGNLNFSRKIVGWYDATPDTAPTPQDYCEHGTHCAGIAAGTGYANSLQASGFTTTTWTYTLEGLLAGYGWLDYGFEIMNPGVITLRCMWTSDNYLVVQLRDATGTTVLADVRGSQKPLVLTYDATESGRYRPLVGITRGTGHGYFSLRETYPYQGRNDGYNLFTGVAPTSKLVGVKVFDNTGSGTLGTVMAGMDWVIANKDIYNITVASMSIGLESGGVDTTFDLKADTMVENGIVTCVSAGNDFPDYTIGSPGTAAYVITVAATNDQNGITSYSSNGNPSKNEYGLIKPDVAAPGGSTNVGNQIISVDSNDVDHEYSGQSDYTPNDYQQMSGTSMSTPHVAGLASLIVDALSGWNWTKDEALKVKMIVSMTAFEVQTGESTNVPPLNRGEKDSKEGYGRICADAAIEAVTMTYDLGELANDNLGPNPSDRKAWARQVRLSAGTDYEFHLSVPSSADYDLYLYNGDPDDYGQPVILEKSVNGVKGAEESVYYTATHSGACYILIRWVSGGGAFNLTSTAEHDVAIASVTPSVTWGYQGQMINITVVADNEGIYTETFNVTVKYENVTAGVNGTIGTQIVTNLAPGTNITLTFNWNTTGLTPCINYTIKAEVSTVPGETDTADNTFIDGKVKVRILGDVNGNGAVDIWDLSIAAMSYGCFYWEPCYNRDADINRDGVVDMRDLTRICLNYGNTC